ncbi:MAG: C25 family cysteine peptidase [Candidatus Zixiibacteriota bacterium]
MSRNLTTLFFLIILFFGFSDRGEAQVTYQVEFSESDLLFEQRDGFDLVSLRGCVGSQKIGSPDLPIRMIHLVLPDGSEVTGVFVTEAHPAILEGEFSIGPVQPDVRTDDLPVKDRIGPDPTVYGSDSPYPSQLVELVHDGMMSGNHVISLALSPLQYRPKSQKLVLYTHLEIRVELGSSEEVDLSSRAHRRSTRAQELREKILFRFVDNQDDVSNCMGKLPGPSQSGADSGSFGYPEYLVVTSPELRSAFLPLVTWKIKKGIEASVVNIDSILSSHSGRDDAEKLRNFLIDAYQNGTSWVLLGGDEDVVPVRYAYPSNTSTTPSMTDQQICDLYFSDVDGEWDLDDDGIWGEPNQDNPDIYPDLFVGRVPCDNTAEANAFVEKLLTYEQNPGDGETGYLTRALWMSSDQMTDWDGGAGQESILSQFIPSHFYQDLTDLAESPTGDAPNPAGPNGETCTEMMNQGWGIIGVLAHGKSSGFVAKSHLTNGTPKSWVTTFAGQNDGHGHLPNLQNESKYGIMYSISCSQSAIDVDKYPYLGGEPSVGEFYPLVSRKAGVAFLGYSRWGWVSISQKLFEKFLENLFAGDPGYHIGVAEALSRCAYPSYRDINYGHNLFGDPEMPVWTNSPATLAVIHPDEVTMGRTNLSFLVTSEGTGVGQASVSLTLRGRRMFLGETDQHGQLTCEVNLDDVGEMSVVVTKPNCIPCQDSITITLSADVDDEDTESGIRSFQLSQNFPNPFNPTTSIQFSVPGGGNPAHTTLRIYNVLGRKVRTLVDELRNPGNHRSVWDGKDDKAGDVSSGIYFYVLEVDDFRETKKMTLMK